MDFSRHSISEGSTNASGEGRKRKAFVGDNPIEEAQATGACMDSCANHHTANNHHPPLTIDHILTSHTNEHDGPFTGPIRQLWMLQGGRTHAPATSSGPSEEDSDEPNPTTAALPFRMVMKLHGMSSLLPGDDTSCPISMEEFDKAFVPAICNGPDECPFVEGVPELCIGKLPCGHRFHAVSLIYHMATNGMKCPVCRYVYIPFSAQTHTLTYKPP